MRGAVTAATRLGWQLRSSRAPGRSVRAAVVHDVQAAGPKTPQLATALGLHAVQRVDANGIGMRYSEPWSWLRRPAGPIRPQRHAFGTHCATAADLWSPGSCR